MLIQVLSFDFDGCLSNDHFLQSTEKDIIQSNQALLDDLKKDKSYSETIVYIGSNRQSLSDDCANSTQGRGSCFPRINRVAQYLEAKLDPFLMADMYRFQSPGYSFKTAMALMNDAGSDYADTHAIINTNRPAITNTNHPKWLHDKGKLTLLYAQMHKVAYEYQDKIIDFKFYDDEHEILEKLCKYLSDYPQMVPSNLGLNLISYTGEPVTESIGMVQGTGKINQNYADSVRKMGDISIRQTPDIATLDTKQPVHNLREASRCNFKLTSSINAIDIYRPGMMRDKQEQFIFNNFVEKLNLFDKQIEKLESRKKTKEDNNANQKEITALSEAIAAGKRLHKELYNYQQDYADNLINSYHFSQCIRSLYNTSDIKILKTHREKWSLKHVLDEILRCLDIMNCLTGQRFFKIKTTTEEKIDDIVKSVDAFTAIAVV